MSLAIQNPYLADDSLWRRGNLHAHTTLSDGESPPEVVIASYERLGYDFLAISDHDQLVPPETYQSLTRMTLVPADEVTRNGPHILAVQIQACVEPSSDRQQALDAIAAQGGFAILNHPNWQQHFNHCPQECMEQWTGYAGIEIYNGVIERLEGSALATDRWDRLLGSGRRVWGFAHDDSHAPGDIARGWNVVQAQEPSVSALCDALRQGRFYASTGVDIARIEAESGTLRVVAPAARRIRFLGAWGRELYYTDADEAAYAVAGNEGGYVRIECFGEGGRTAWTQPFTITEDA